MQKVFISYNHKDQATALQIRDRLVSAGFEAIIDVEKMQSGQDIKQFILQCIRESGVTISLVSVNSLLSAWVAMETINSGVDTGLRDRVFIPAYIDRSFFERSFTAQAMEKIETELVEIDGLMRTALDKGWGIEDLQSERSRYLAMRAALPEIIGKLRNSLCIDLSPEHFEGGMEKIIGDLKAKAPAIPQKDDTKVAEPSSLKSETAQAMSSLETTIAGILDDATKQRLQGVSKRLQSLQELLDKYQEELDFESDPKRQMRYEREIAMTKRSIEKILEEVKELTPATT